MTTARRVSFSHSIDSLKGSLSQTSVPDLLQLIHSGQRTGEFYLKRSPDGKEARLYFSNGHLAHATLGDVEGMVALSEALECRHGAFSFTTDVLTPRVTIDLPLQHAILEAVRLHDEQDEQNDAEEFSIELPFEEETELEPQQSAVATTAQEGERTVRSSTDALEDCLKVPGVSSAVVIGRDGFLIESAGGSKNVNLETLGASLAHAVNGIEEMGSELEIQGFQDMFVEYGRSVIMCRPVGGAIIAIVAPDASKLGIIRHKIKPLVDELGAFF
jgi:predicted regulator of Ras-like GTPase activity (Roadblock/LC7/MglB family)